jgi:hypothetical protein
MKIELVAHCSRVHIIAFTLFANEHQKLYICNASVFFLASEYFKVYLDIFTVIKTKTNVV